MYSYNDFERLFVRYKLEGIPGGGAIEKALNNMNTFGAQLFAYLNDGSYSVYHTIISTCKMQGVSVLDYFKRFFSEIVKGRRDYEHLLPLTIGLEQ